MAYKNSPTNPVQTLTNADEATKVILVDADGNNVDGTTGGVAVTEYTEADTVASGNGVLGLGKNGTTIKAIQTDASGNLVESNSATIAGDTTSIDGKITACNTGAVVISQNTDSIDGAGAPTIDSYTNAAISASANTANQSLIAAPGANKQIWVYGIQYTVGTGDGSASFQDEDDTAITGVMEHAQYSGLAVPPSGNYAMPMWKLATNKALEVDTVTCDIKGSIQYAIVSV